MPRADLPPSLPHDFVDGMHDALERVAAVADLLTLAGPPGGADRLQCQTIPHAAAIILGETARMRALLAERDPTFAPDPPGP